MIARLRQFHPLALVALLVVIGILFWMLSVLVARGPAGGLFWIGAALLWMLAWIGNDALAHSATGTRSLSRLRDFAVPAVFGITLLFLWQLIVKGFGIPAVLLPAPSDIWTKLIASLPILREDFIQTFVRAVLPGWAIGSLAGFLVAIACDAWGFLRRGLLPLGNLFAALPIVGIAPIMVMWFGFDWHSKAAVVVIMTFFPMLVNAIAGLAASGHLERDLMRSYGASYWTTLFKLRLPAAMPFIFNALKINSTLAMIGAIVAEFFGTPIVGMGFRISTEVGRLGLDMVWAEIAVAAIAGSAFYGLLALIERAVTFWHPSYRR
jgi:NitT/TauT family transport system permease protein